jgi:predicted GIY-YIG superfamily endonuclease
MIYDSVIYILRLEGQKYYVGTSGNLPRRLQDHFRNRGSAWTKKYKPLEVMDILEKKDIFTEDNTTKSLMFKHGLDHVRGGSYCQVKLTPADVTTLTKENKSVHNLCYHCGESHFARYCKKNKKK